MEKMADWGYQMFLFEHLCSSLNFVIAYAPASKTDGDDVGIWKTDDSTGS